MTLVVVTLFDHPDKAKQGMHVLEDAGFDRSKIETIESDPESQSFFKRIFSKEGRGEEMEAEKANEFLLSLGIPEDNAEHYAKKVRKGNSLVIVRCESEQEAERARQLFTRSGEEEFDEGKKERAGVQGRKDLSKEETGPRARTDTGTKKTGKETIEAVEEELVVGKRTKETGGVRAEKHVEEKEVEETVELSEEDVSVERRDVDRPLREGEKAFEEEAIEVSETREEAVAKKEPKVREEVVINKDVESRPETIKDTVRRERIDIENLSSGETGARFNQFEPDYRSHFDKEYKDSDASFDEYSHGYRYGMALAENDEYRGQDWETVEPEARTEWETQQGGGTWDNFKDSVRYGWDRMRGKEEGERRSPNR